MPLIDTSLIGNRTKLAKTIGTDDDSIIVSSGEGVSFKTKTGNPYYITVRSSVAMERMLVLNVNGDELFVNRGQDNTVPQRFYAGSCISVEWNPEQLAEFIKMNGLGNALPNGYNGTIDPYSIIEVKDGLIIKVTKGVC